ncbi:hypothetical protein AMS68_005939 [Peltaster fructicola]|uniref:ZZ-type domain-containing protein n=1 Tax=Peltaster fructicola TaxID=286661 RepID=A0A6H0Y063_9PEZI|nr:hypothetical protein AMS68_005939 [Peltaster fructicola]
MRRDAVQDPAPRTPPSLSRPRRLTPPYPDTRNDGLQSIQQAESRHQARPIPEVACDRCGKTDIQHDLHYHCNKCSDGNFDLCLRCYRTGQGCNHWFGFGYVARARWDKHAPPGGYPPEYETPHVLTARRYVRRSPERGTTETGLQEGAFCEGCFKHADQSYWHCNACFEGAWGYCLACVQQEKHCTHPLAPVTRVPDQQRVRDIPGIGRLLPLPHLPTNDYYSYLPTTTCAVSRAIIPPDQTRLHCSQCNNGNYDICNDSYNSLMATGKISNANGLSGWRLCLQGHPMSVVVFRNVLDNVHQRVVVSDVVGGWKAKDKSLQASTQTQHDIPSSLRAVALWSWWPADGVEDELAFPKHAELEEVEEINTDYYAGVYASSRGLFPANHVRMS